MNRFRLHRLIGRGGMGEVYEAEALIPGVESKPVALKVMRSNLRQRARYTELFQREARINLDISHEHPGMVTVFGHFEDRAGQLYIVMDLIRGCSLHALLKDYQRLPPDLIVYIAAQMLDAIAYMHGLGYLHLDLSPSNVLLTNDGRVKISDLGLTRATPADGGQSRHIAKPPYASPEVLRAGTVDNRSDLYSFAAIVFQMAMGKPPYGHKHDIQHVMARLANWQPPPLGDLPPQLRVLIGDLFHEDPDMRWPQSAQTGRDTLPTTRAMQRERAQIAAMVEPIYLLEHRDSLRERVPQLCFDVPAMVEQGSTGMLDDTEPGVAVATPTDTAVQLEGDTDSADGIAETSWDVSGLDWTPGNIVDVTTEPERADLAPTAADSTGRLRDQEIVHEPPDGQASGTRYWRDSTLEASDGGRFAPVFPAQAGCGHDTSTARHTIRQVSGILPTKEVATGMSIEDPTTRFLDALFAWYQSGEPASGDEVTAVPIDLADVHKAYHQLDQVLQNESAVQWSHFLQACQIHPPRREWVWRAIEDLTLRLGYDVMYFETGPEPADEPEPEPEPEEIEERPATKRDVKWAKRIYYSLHEDVHGYRPDGIAAVMKDMDEVQRFLAQLGAIAVSLPALRTPDSLPPSGKSLRGLEKGISRLFRFHDALPETDKEVIEREWTELASALYNYTEARQYLRSLCKRMADKLGHSSTEELEDATTTPLHKVDGQTRLAVVRAGTDSGEITVPGELRVQVRQSRADRGDVELVALPTLPAAQGEPAVAGPALLPDDESRRWTQRMTRRVGAIGGTIVALAAVVMFVLLPEPQPVPKKRIAVGEQPEISKLPMTAFEYPVCEASVQPSISELAPQDLLQTPRRTEPTIKLPTGNETVVLKRKNKPDLKLTVAEVPSTDANSPLTEDSEIVTFDMDKVDGHSIKLEGFGESIRLDFEAEP